MFINYHHLCVNFFSQLNEELDDIYLADLKTEPKAFIKPLIRICFSSNYILHSNLFAFKKRNNF